MPAGGSNPSGVTAPVVLAGLDNPTGLQTTRIFAGRGIPVIGLAADPGHFCCRTRVCGRVLPTDLGSERLIEDLLHLSAQLGGSAVLVPTTDDAVAIVSQHRARLEGRFEFMLPPHDLVTRLMDKRAFGQLASEFGLPVTRTLTVGSADELHSAAGTLRFPIALKPPFKSPRWQRLAGGKAFRAADRDALLRIGEQALGWSDELVLQEWIEGPEHHLVSVNAYFDANSQPLVTFVARKLRQWPRHAGNSSLGEECRDDEALALAVDFFRRIGYRGLAYLECKRDVRSGELFAIEANVGRPTGRSAIAEAGGVELLHTMYCDLRGLPLPGARTQTYGSVKWVHLKADLQSAFGDWRQGTLGPREWVRSLRGRKHYAVLSWRDPAPFAFELRHAAAEAGRRLLRRGRGADPDSADRDAEAKAAPPSKRLSA